MYTDWIWGFAGGSLIGIAAAVYLLGNGWIMGASGIIGGLLNGSARDTWMQRLVFLAALVAVPAGLQVLSTRDVQTHLSDNWLLLISAGLCVGVGTRLGNGCTSGHGVCGISRLNPRGIVATLFYIGAGAITVVAARALVGF